MIAALEPAATSYDCLAPFYDEFTSAYAYEPWIDAIEQRAVAWGLEGKRALDLACGTGKSTLPLLARGYSIQGCDISEGMIRRAQDKLPELAEAFSVADMRELPELGEFDFVLCLDDAVNYLLSDEELEAAFAGVARILAPDGIFAFDVNSLATYRTSFAETEVREQGGIFFAWRGEAAPTLQAAEGASATVEIFAPNVDGLWERHTMRHVQRHHPRSAIVAALQSAGLKCCAVFGQRRGAVLEDQADEESHIKLVYLAKPQDPRPGREVTGMKVVQP
ncbi:MAG TPA: class I SAM-dependent methyltransferase [Solirubrobacteraceae bacterium]|nr:class I SAM-dependent methyltransferase [Solirubrobacteraceae bacterium]